MRNNFLFIYGLVLLTMLLQLMACKDDPILSDGKEITTFSFRPENNPGLANIANGTIAGNTISVNVIGLDNLSNLVATFTGVGSVTVKGVRQVSDITPNNFANDVIYTVTADDGSSIDYTVKVTFISSDKNITSFLFLPELNPGLSDTAVGTINGYNITVDIKAIKNPAAMIATFTGAGIIRINEVMQASGVTPNDFTKEIIYTVTADDGTSINYTVNVFINEVYEVPKMIINTVGGAPIVDRENYINCTVQITGSAHPDYNISLALTKDGIRGRGNTTWGQDKKPYRIKFNQAESLLGLKPEKSWVLLANYQDPTLMMHAIGFELGHRLGLPFTNHSRYVELTLNGEYLGIYQLTEQIEVAPNRVDVDKNNGCLLELDKYFDEPWEFMSGRFQLPVMIKSPKDFSENMDITIKNWVQDLENSLPPSAIGNYADLIDVSSLINYLLINEAVCNTEIHHPKSTYMHKNPNGKFYMGPIWDLDYGYSYGGDFDYFFWPTSALLFQQDYFEETPGANFFCRFFEDAAFRQQYKARWNEVKAVHFDNIDEYIDRLAAQLQEAQVRNFQKWENGKMYNEQIGKLKQWLKDRIAYMDVEINKM